MLEPVLGVLGDPAVGQQLREFVVGHSGQAGQHVTNVGERVDPQPPASTAKASGWSIDVGIRKHKGQAWRFAKKIIRKHRKTLKGGRPLPIPRVRGVLLYRACITGLKYSNAFATCKNMRAKGEYCIILNLKMAKIALRAGRIASRNVSKSAQ